MPEGSRFPKMLVPSGCFSGFKRVPGVSTFSLLYILAIFHFSTWAQRVPSTLCGAQRVLWDPGTLSDPPLPTGNDEDHDEAEDEAGGGGRRHAARHQHQQQLQPTKRGQLQCIVAEK